MSPSPYLAHEPERVYDIEPPEEVEGTMTTVERRIHLYRVKFETRTKDDVWEAVKAPEAIFDAIALLSPTPGGTPSRYLKLADTNELFMQIDQRKPRVQGQFTFKRTSGIPPLERSGHYRRLRLAPGEGLAEIRHFVFVPRGRLLGIEVNGQSAGISRWAQYIEEVCPHLVTRVTAEMLISGDIAQTLRRITKVRGASITVLRDLIGPLSRLDGGLAAGVQSLSSASDSLEIRIGFDVGTRKRDAEIHLPWLDRLPGFLTNSESRESLREAVIRAYDPLMLQTRNIDLLEDRFVGRRSVQQLDDGTIIAASIYAAIEAVIAELPASITN